MSCESSGEDDDEFNVALCPRKRLVETSFAYNRVLVRALENLPPGLVRAWARTEDHGWVIEIDEVTLELSGHLDENDALTVSATGDMPRRLLDPLRSELRDLTSKVACSDGGVLSAFDHGVLFLQLVEAVAARVLEWKPDAPFVTSSEQPKSWDVSTRNVSDWHSLLTSQAGLDLSTVDDVAQHLLHKPIADICAGLPSWLRIIHVEPVFRNDLVSGFLARQGEIEQQLRKLPAAALRASLRPQESQRIRTDRHETLVQHLASPRVTFHGAPRHVVSSIVRHGFLKPGQRIARSKHIVGNEEKVHVRSGSTYGRGIYSSPAPMFASRYTDYGSGTITRDGSWSAPASQIPGMRLIVCAALLGRQRTVTRATAYRVDEVLGGEGGGFHSHVSQNGYECIVFENSQIIPCYVLHLDFGAERAKQELEKLPDDPQEFARAKKKAEKRARQKQQEEEEALFPGLAKDKKEALKAMEEVKKQLKDEKARNLATVQRLEKEKHDIEEQTKTTVESVEREVENLKQAAADAEKNAQGHNC